MGTGPLTALEVTGRLCFAHGVRARHEQLKMVYYSRLFRFQQSAAFLFEGNKIRAAINGIDEYGRLTLTTDDGSELVAAFKEIEFLF